MQYVDDVKERNNVLKIVNQQPWTYHIFLCHEVACTPKKTTVPLYWNTREANSDNTGVLANSFLTTVPNEQMACNNNYNCNTN